MTINIAVIIVLALIIVGAVTGITKGFVKMVFALGSTIVAIILTIWLNPFTTNILSNNEKIMSTIRTKVEQSLEKKEDAEEKPDALLDSSAEDELFKDIEIPEILRKSLEENGKKELDKAIEEEKANIKRYVADYITTLVVKAIAFIGTFLLVSALLWLLCHLLNLVSKLPVLNGLNHLLGCIAGALEGLVVVWLLMVLLAAIANTPLGLSIYAMIGESKFLTFICEHNLILYFIGL